MSPGDTLIMIEGRDARTLRHFDAYDLVKSAGNRVELTLRKANSQYLVPENMSHQEKLEQQMIDERYTIEMERKRRKELQAKAMSPPRKPFEGTGAIPKNTSTMSVLNPKFNLPLNLPQTFPDKDGESEQSSSNPVSCASSPLQPQPLTGIGGGTSNAVSRITSNPVSCTSSPLQPKPLPGTGGGASNAVSRITSNPVSCASSPLQPQPLPGIGGASNAVSRITSMPMPVPDAFPFATPTQNSSSSTTLPLHLKHITQKHSQSASSLPLNVQAETKRYSSPAGLSQSLPKVTSPQEQFFTPVPNFSPLDASSVSNYATPVQVFSPPAQKMSHKLNEEQKLPEKQQIVIPSEEKALTPTQVNPYHLSAKLQQLQAKEQYNAFEKIHSHSTSQVPQNVSSVKETKMSQSTSHVPQHSISQLPTQVPISPSSSQDHIPTSQPVSSLSTSLSQSSSNLLPQTQFPLKSTTLSQSMTHITQAQQMEHIEIQDPMFLTEEQKRRQLQQLILEKRRLEEMMMIAKKRESSIPKDSPVANKERSPTPIGRERTPSVGRENRIERTPSVGRESKRERTPSVGRESKRERTPSVGRESTPSKREGTPSSTSKNEKEKSSIRKEEEEKIREDNRIRDEEIRKMQQQKLEDKRKKEEARKQKKLLQSSFLSEEKMMKEMRRLKDRDKKLQGIIDFAETKQSMSKEDLRDSQSSLDQISNTDTAMIEAERKKHEARKKIGEQTSLKLQLSDEKRKHYQHIALQEKKKAEEKLVQDQRKKIQEQFKKDQLRIQEEMKKQEESRQREQVRLMDTLKQFDIDQQDKKNKLKKKKEQDGLRKLEQQKLADALKELDEKRKEDQRRDEQRRLDAAQKQSEERKRNEEEKRNEEQRKQEEKDRLTEEKKLLEQKIKEEENRKIEEQKQKLEEEKKKLEEVKRKLEEERKLKQQHQRKAEEQRRKEEQKRTEEQKRREEAKKQEEKRRLEEKIKNEELKRKAEQKQEEEQHRQTTLLQKQQEEVEELERLEEMKRHEEERMAHEAQQYEDYRRHLEQRAQLYDSDDYASDDIETPTQEEKFEELTATSEEELYEAQEKSVRNLERQIKRQEEREHRRKSEERNNREIVQVYRKAHSASEGDLRSSNSRTMPITKFSPDPMEFGFKPIDKPIRGKLSKSMGNLDTGASAAAVVAVAGAEAGAEAGISATTGQTADQLSAGWDNTYPLSCSLGDLQQVSSKPPLPMTAPKGKIRLRHAASEELLPRSHAHSASEDPRRYTYCVGDEQDFFHVDPSNPETMDYSRLLSEYYAAYYEAYYQSYYRRQQSELKEGNMSAGGPPPPPPPPPLPGVIPATRLPSEIPRHIPQKAPPMALAGAMMKDKKPFTYTPGGIDLSEINTQYRPQQNGSVATNAAPTTNGTSNPNAPTSVPNNPVQSRAFRVLQNVLDNNDTADTPIQGAPMKIEVPLGSPNHIRRGSSQLNGKFQSENSIVRVIPIVQAGTDTRVISTNEKQQSNVFKNQVKVSSDVVDEARSRGGHFPQETEPQGPVHLPNLRNKYGQSHPQQQLHQQPMSAPIGSQLGGVNAAPSEQQTAPEPKKYMGGAIPSRSFKMLQQMTGSNDVTNVGDSTTTTTLSEPLEGEDNPHAATHNPSPSSQSSYTSSPDPPTNHKPLSRASSTDSGISSSSSKVCPQYMSARDGKVYRNVTPKLVVNGSNQEKIVNPALRSGSLTSRTVSPMPWKNGNNYPSSPRSYSPVPGSPSPLEQSNAQFDLENNSRVVKIIRQDSNISTASTDSEKRYEGAYIPSRVFRYLQNEYADKNENSETEYQNGIQGTAVQKETVLKELCSQFDQTGIVQKPKAAPGKIFRHLQEQYDNEDPSRKSDVQSVEDESRNLGFNGSKNPSPSFRFLQSQYQNEESKDQQKKEETEASDAPEYEKEPNLYNGGRAPGQTFRMINSNISAHPSVFGNRK